MSKRKAMVMVKRLEVIAWDASRKIEQFDMDRWDAEVDECLEAVGRAGFSDVRRAWLHDRIIACQKRLSAALNAWSICLLTKWKPGRHTPRHGPGTAFPCRDSSPPPLPDPQPSPRTPAAGELRRFPMMTPGLSARLAEFEGQAHAHAEAYASGQNVGAGELEGFLEKAKELSVNVEGLPDCYKIRTRIITALENINSGLIAYNAAKDIELAVLDAEIEVHKAKLAGHYTRH